MQEWLERSAGSAIKSVDSGGWGREWLERSASGRLVHAREVDGKCKSGWRGVVGEECNSSRSGMQESAGVKKQVQERWMGNARVVREECK